MKLPTMKEDSILSEDVIFDKTIKSNYFVLIPIFAKKDAAFFFNFQSYNYLHDAEKAVFQCTF